MNTVGCRNDGRIRIGEWRLVARGFSFRLTACVRTRIGLIVGKYAEAGSPVREGLTWVTPRISARVDAGRRDGFTVCRETVCVLPSGCRG